MSPIPKIQLVFTSFSAVERWIARVLAVAEVNAMIGMTAWKVWVLLCNDGPQTFPQLERKLHETSDLLNLSLGWLAREDRVEITRERGGLRVRARKALLGASRGLRAGERNKPSSLKRGKVIRNTRSA